MSLDEFTHLMGLRSVSADKFIALGNIAAYDPVLVRVRLILPTYKDLNGQPIMTPWVQLGTPWAGNGWGLQIAPYAQGTIQNPNLGEPAILLIIEQDGVVGVCAFMFFGATFLPPVTNLPPGEAIMQHKTGTYIRFLTNGDLNINGSHQINVTSTSDINATSTTGNINATTTAGSINAFSATGSINLTASLGAVSISAQTINLNGNQSITLNSPLINIASTNQLNLSAPLTTLTGSTTLGLFGGTVSTFATTQATVSGPLITIGADNALTLDGGANAFLTAAGLNIYNTTAGQTLGPTTTTVKQIINYYFPGAANNNPGPQQPQQSSEDAGGGLAAPPALLGNFATRSGQNTVKLALGIAMNQPAAPPNPSSTSQDASGSNITQQPPSLQTIITTTTKYLPGGSTGWQKAVAGELRLDSAGLLKNQGTTLTLIGNSIGSMTSPDTTINGDNLLSLTSPNVIQLSAANNLFAQGGQINIATDPLASAVGKGNIQVATNTGSIQIASTNGPIDIATGTFTPSASSTIGLWSANINGTATTSMTLDGGTTLKLDATTVDVGTTSALTGTVSIGNTSAGATLRGSTVSVSGSSSASIDATTVNVGHSSATTLNLGKSSCTVGLTASSFTATTSSITMTATGTASLDGNTVDLGTSSAGTINMGSTGTGGANVTIDAHTLDTNATTTTMSSSGSQNLNSTGSATITGSSIWLDSTTVQAGSGTFEELVNQSFQNVFNNHVHSGVSTGSGNSGIPTTTLAAAQLTTNFKAT